MNAAGHSILLLTTFHYSKSQRHRGAGVEPLQGSGTHELFIITRCHCITASLPSQTPAHSASLQVCCYLTGSSDNKRDNTWFLFLSFLSGLIFVMINHAFCNPWVLKWMGTLQTSEYQHSNMICRAVALFLEQSFLLQPFGNSNVTQNQPTHS